ncbi:MAG: hypothetical protein IAA73_00490 [Bacteroidetes bacterium]|uniref:RHS repeat-associated core domain-containing protein n=1 Tax=Candidatus Gallipaludibacter merdavium TaxID=2840839 RepID=A0A9D9HS03_9BACT|nr:hypothetical protein [Candidatus Gallipaludibacter merdavium]
MKRPSIHYVLLIAIAVYSVQLWAQTPYDSFAQQAYSPILDWDSIQALQKQGVAEEFTLQEDTIVLTPCLAAIDTAEQLVLLVDTLQNMLVCTPLTDKLLRWLSVDPMADDYLHISPYAYCVWNPVRHIDPDGRDVWDIDQNGNIINHIKDTSKDAFYIVQQDNDGNYQRMTDDNGKELCIEFEYGTIEKQKTVLATRGYFDMYEIRGDRQATQLFEFFARSTEVEWGHAKTGIAGEKGLNFITTSHNGGREYGFGYVYNNRLRYGYTIRELNHNHPEKPGKDQSRPSEADYNAAHRINEYLQNRGLPKAKYNIYTKSKTYSPYEAKIK